MKLESSFLKFVKKISYLLLINLFLILSFSRAVHADQTGIKNYREARDIFWEELYQDGATSLYCGAFEKDRKGEINIEHIYPASWMKPAAKCEGQNRKNCRRNSTRFNVMEGDLHNLYPALKDVNSARGNLTFTIIPGTTNRFNVVDAPSCDFEKVDSTVEPAIVSRGEIARAIFYMNDEYGAEIGKNGKQEPELVELLTEWHCSDPVSPEEKRRNDTIEELQGNRNPFIDQPERIACPVSLKFPTD